MKKKMVYIVPHSHWDREWYFTIEDSNILLSENLPYLMDVLENDKDFKHYVFDAQASLIEEFLKVNSEEKERLKKLANEDRIIFGPWYTQTDSLLVNKESIIRNLLYGTRVCNKFSKSMMVGYLPDIFGQNPYLPSIFSGFGIEYSILQRGLYTDELKNNLNFTWKSPDGKEVKANNIFLGYGPGKFLSSDSEYVNEKLLPMLDKLSELNKDTDNILLPSGGDQVLVRKDFPKIVEELNKMDIPYSFKMSSYEEFMKETWQENNFDNVIEGELRACQKSRIHSTIGSQRYDIKKLNSEVENKILYVLEPLITIANTLGIKYKYSWLDIMWKSLFDAHAHDSIGGCNSDDTNRDIVHRLTKVTKMADDIINITKKQLAKAISREIGKDNILVLFNTNIKKQTKNMEAVIFTREKEFDLTDLNSKSVSFDIVNQEEISGGKQVVVTAEGEKEIQLPPYYKSTINIFGEEIDALGFKTFLVNEKPCDVFKINNVEDNFIENKRYKIEFKGSSLALTYNNETIENFICFEKQKDGGDSYDFSPVLGDEPIYFEKCELLKVQKSRNVQKMEVIFKGELDIQTTFEIRNDESIMRVSHKIVNNLKEHRIRAIFKTQVKNSVKSYKDQGFTIIEKDLVNPRLNTWREEKFAEAPVAINSLENFAALSDKNNTFSLITEGLKEYEGFEDGKLALTLFRSVELLGRDDLLWRPGRASGINNKVVYTKDAAMQGELDFSYAIYLNNDHINNSFIFNVCEEFIKHNAVYMNQSLNTFFEPLERFEIPLNHGNIKPDYSLFDIYCEKVNISVIKMAEDKDGIILRLFNSHNEEVSFKLNCKRDYKISEVNLAEEEIQKVESDNILINPRGYITLKLKNK